MSTSVFVDTQSTAYDFSSKEKTKFLDSLGDYKLCISYFSYLEILAKDFNSTADLSLTLVNLYNKGFYLSSNSDYPDIEKLIDDTLICKISLSAFKLQITRLLNMLKFEYVVARSVIEHFLYYLIKKSGSVLPDDRKINSIIDEYNSKQFNTIIIALELQTFKDEDVNELLVKKSKLVKKLMNINSFKKTIKCFFSGLEEVQIINLINVFCKRNKNILKPFRGLNSLGTVLGFDLYYQVFGYLDGKKTLEPKINNIIDFYNLCLISENSLLLTRDKMAKYIIEQLADNLKTDFLIRNKRVNDIFIEKFKDKSNIAKIY